MSAFEHFRNVTASGSISLEKLLASLRFHSTQSIEGGGYPARDVMKTDLSGEKRRHRAFIRGVEHSRRGSAGFAGGDPEPERREARVVYGLVGKRRQLDGIEGRDAVVRDSFRMRERVEHRQLHCRNAHLSDDAPVDEFDERMDDALRVNNDFDAVVGQIEQNVRLDYLERFVRERSAVDRVLPPHAPGRVPQSIRDTHPGETLRAPPAKRSTRSGENNAPHFTARMPGDALKDRRVLAVDRYELAMPILCGLLHEIAGDHERFLVGERDALPSLESRERRLEAGHADNGVDHNVHIAASGRLDERLCPTAPALSCLDSRLNHADESGSKPVSLLLEQRRV